jgi:YjbE family integral membrane protein
VRKKCLFFGASGASQSSYESCWASAELTRDQILCQPLLEFQNLASAYGRNEETRSAKGLLPMELGILGNVTFDWDFLSGLISVIIVNVILSGDNAVVIAMAVRSLPRSQRKKGIIIGAAGAVLLRIVLTFFVARMLQTPYLKLIGGLVIVWLAVKLFVDVTPEDEADQEAGTIWQAFKIIVIADITMSLDNMLGVGAASRGNMFLLVFGLTTSIPIMIFASNLLSMLMDKYPIILYFGAALLGKVGGEMIITDPVVTQFLTPSEFLIYIVEGGVAIGVIIAGKLWVRLMRRNS